MESFETVKIEFSKSAVGLQPEDVTGFFVGWENQPSPGKLIEILEKSDYKIIAKENGKVVGLVTAISDGVISAYIPLLEVLPEYQGQGIGSELVKRMLKKLDGFYMIDLMCDGDMQEFYERFGMERASGMRIRNMSKPGK